MFHDFAPLIHEVLDANLVVFSASLALPKLHHLVELIFCERLTVVVFLLFYLLLGFLTLFFFEVLDLVQVLFHFHLLQQLSLLLRKLGVFLLPHGLFLETHDFTLLKLSHLVGVDN